MPDPPDYDPDETDPLEPEFRQVRRARWPGFEPDESWDKGPQPAAQEEAGNGS